MITINKLPHFSLAHPQPRDFPRSVSMMMISTKKEPTIRLLMIIRTMTITGIEHKNGPNKAHFCNRDDHCLQPPLGTLARETFVCSMSIMMMMMMMILYNNDKLRDNYYNCYYVI